MHHRINICGVSVHNVSMDETIKTIETYVKRHGESSNEDSVTEEYHGKHHMITFMNVDILVQAQNRWFRSIMEQSSLVLADGVPILWASRLMGTPLVEKVSGSDLFPRLCAVAAEKGYRLFFLGGRPGSASRTASRMNQRYPSLNICGVYCPPYGFENDKTVKEKIVRIIREARPDILFIGLGAPKQEQWMHEFRDQVCVPVSIGIGGTFEFEAGYLTRAPLWMQKVGLEWFWRLCKEPRRLWKRYLVRDLRFFGLLGRQKLRSFIERNRQEKTEYGT
jgi:N-acetylglucosaminyldiphosphoundecaprenol N-acetyl-beta-D-mannosaminyltransferase